DYTAARRLRYADLRGIVDQRLRDVLDQFYHLLPSFSALCAGSAAVASKTDRGQRAYAALSASRMQISCCATQAKAIPQRAARLSLRLLRPRRLQLHQLRRTSRQLQPHPALRRCPHLAEILSRPVQRLPWQLRAWGCPARPPSARLRPLLRFRRR